LQIGVKSRARLSGFAAALVDSLRAETE